MGLKAIETHGCGSCTRNAGILKTKQIELTARTSDPSDSDLADARIYYNSTDQQYYAYAGSEFLPLVSGSGMRVTTVTATTTLTAAEAGLVVVKPAVNSSTKITLPLSTAVKGLTFIIKKASASKDDIQIARSAITESIDGTGGAVTVYNTDLNSKGDYLVLTADGGGSWYITGRRIQ